jgi:hypothetical protein
MNSARTLVGALALVAVTFLTGALTEQDARDLATDAYIFGYPLVTMEMTRRVMTNVATAGDKFAPMGQFARMGKLPTPKDKEVTAPNVDMLCTVAWVDVSREPYVLSFPDTKGRFFMMPMLDAWTNVFQDPGSRTTGTGFQTYAITGPSWRGARLPPGVNQVKSRTNIVWILGRIYTTGAPQDLEEARAYQDKITLMPLSHYGRPYTPPPGKVDPKIDMTTPVRDQVNAMDALTFFKVMAEAMKKNPPAAADAPMMMKLAKLGIVPGKNFDARKLSVTEAEALKTVPKSGQDRIMANVSNTGVLANGWMIAIRDIGEYHVNYLQRATIAAIGLGATLPADAVYPMSEATADGQPYDGANKYVMHFDKGQIPPVKGLWSLTMYDDKYFLVPNPIERHALGTRDKLATNSDGSVDLYLQKDSPGAGKESNWLPAPPGQFVLMLRLYWPNDTPPTILDGSWKPPPVQRTAQR